MIPLTLGILIGPVGHPRMRHGRVPPGPILGLQDAVVVLGEPGDGTNWTWGAGSEPCGVR